MAVMHGKNVGNILISGGIARENGIIRMTLFEQSAETLAGDVKNTKKRTIPNETARDIAMGKSSEIAERKK